MLIFTLPFQTLFKHLFFGLFTFVCLSLAHTWDEQRKREIRWQTEKTKIEGMRENIMR